MSEPSTPARSMIDPTNAPSSAYSQSSHRQLTPRSKVKALLAELDSSSESDKENKGAQEQERLNTTRPASAKSRKSFNSAGNFRDAQQSASPFYSRDLDNATANTKEQIISSNKLGQASERESAYERVKKRFPAGDQTTSINHIEENTGPAKGNSTLKEPKLNQEDLAVSTRQPKTSSTPVSSASGCSDSRSSLPGPVLSSKESPSPLGNENVEYQDDEAERRNKERKQSRLQQLVARKREERLAKESDADQSSSDDEVSQSSAKLARKPKRAIVEAESEDDGEKEAGKKFTHQARPTRKAGKKALQEMTRETQRMSRNMQLTHQAQTKTKFNTADLFKKMNFRQPKRDEHDVAATDASSSSPPRPVFDVEDLRGDGTPPSSPPSQGASQERPCISHHKKTHAAMISPSRINRQGQKRSASREQPETVHKWRNPKSNEANRLSVRQFAKSAKRPPFNDEIDDDLEIVEAFRPNRLNILDGARSAKPKEPHSMNALRALAHLNGHENRRNKSTSARSSMNPTELYRWLRERAREQALMENNEKIQALREKGVLVQTEEERERDRMQLENMLDKARKGAEELAKKEKEAVKTEGKEDNDLPDSEDEDGDFEASDDGASEDLSGSEEETGAVDGLEQEDEQTEADDEMGDGSDYGKDEASSLPQDSNDLMFDDEAAEQEDAEEDESAQVYRENELDAEDEGQTPARLLTKPRRNAPVVLDDSDPDEVLDIRQQPKLAMTTPKASIVAAFGFNKAKSPAMGLSQVFAGTIAETQSQGDNGDGSEEDSLAFSRGLPPSDLPELEPILPNETPSRVGDSQVDIAPRSDSQVETKQKQFHYDTESPFRFTQRQTQTSDMPEPTQDVGFETNFSPAKTRQSPVERLSHSTVETVLLPSQQTPEVQRKGRLRRGRELVNVISTLDPPNSAPDNVSEGENDPHSGDAFHIMRRAAREAKSIPTYDKNKSEAKGMVEEQAEESDDEYKGLGGASDEEDHGEADDELERMMNDESKEKLNERDVAAYFADKERADDEKLIEKLYKDINSGRFRRKRGADLDLLDSDDEEEAAARRRAAKQKEFAKMRKALLADEKIGKIAENPKRQAFLQAIEDREDDDDNLDFLEQPEQVPTQVVDSQKDATSHGAQETSIRKRRRSDSRDASPNPDETIPSPRKRLTVQHTKPTSLAQIRDTLSEIIGEPESILDSQQPSAVFADGNDNESSSDESFIDKDDQGPPETAVANPDKNQLPLPGAIPTNPLRSHAVVDRLSLKRAGSSNASLDVDPKQTRLAFQAPSKTSSSGFKVPSLLRRATTNASNPSSESGADRSAAAVAMGLIRGGRDGIKLGGSKKSSVNYYVREEERRAKVEVGERTRLQDRMRVGRMRGEGSLGGLSGGIFE